jgi:hypothetical protein
LPPRTSCRPRSRIPPMAERDLVQEGILVTLATSPATCCIPIYKPAKSPVQKHLRYYKNFTSKSESGRAFPLSKIIQTMTIADLIATDACAEPLNPQWVKLLSLRAMLMVLKVASPLVVTAAQVAEFVSAVHDVVDFAHRPGSFWSEAMGLARREIGA